MVLRLEVFETEEKPGNSSAIVLDSAILEEAKLESFDAGYSAGWEDAAAAQSGDQSRIRADLARSLQDLGFTYQEARSHLLRSLRPLLEDVLLRLVPEISREALGAIVLDTLMPLAESLADTPVTLVVNPAARPAVEPLLASATGLPLVIEEEPSLGEGQVYLRLAGNEVLIDTDRAVATISAALRGFLDLSLKENSHG